MATGGVIGSDLIDQVLLCQICLNPLFSRKARQLSCLHTFCESCLENLLIRTPGSKINCSICRQITEIPEGLVANLPLNFNIEQANQMAKEMAKTPFCTKCINKNEFVRAKKRCISCKWQMCEPCKKKHDGYPGFTAHLVESIILETAKSEVPNCRSHNLPITLICTTCKQLLCTDCLMATTHDAHPGNIKLIDVACNENRKIVSGKKADLIKALDILGANKQDTLRIQEHVQRVKKDIIEFADSLKSQIDENVQVLIGALEQNYTAKSHNRKTSLCEALENISLYLRKVEEFEAEENIEFLEKSESWIQDVKTFEQMIQNLMKGDDVQLVKFSKHLQISTIGRFENIDQVPSGLKDMESLTTEDLERLSSTLKDQNIATPKPSLIKKYMNFPINYYRSIATMDDGTAVCVAEAEGGLVRINIEGEILSRYTHNQPMSITTVSTFCRRIIFTSAKTDSIYELALDGQSMILVKTYKKHGIKAHGVCLDHGGYVILYGEKMVAKLDHGGNIMWQKNVDRPCSGVSPVSLDHKQCYLVNSESTGETEIWNQYGKVIGSLQYPLSGCSKSVSHTSVTPRGSFIVTHGCQDVHYHRIPHDHNTVSEYAPDGSFIRHLLTKTDGIDFPCIISCNQQGYMWLTDAKYRQYCLNIYKL